METASASDQVGHLMSNGRVNKERELKRTCEECTRSKVKCSGPEKGVCDRCALRSTPCVFRTKLKRGPLPASLKAHTIDAKAAPSTDAVGTLKRQFDSMEVTAQPAPVMSWHERRCWNILFSIFKNQSVYESPFAWCWFALQINKLKQRLTKEHQINAMAPLETFIGHLEAKISSLETTDRCNLPPHLCGACSAVAMVGPGKNNNVCQGTKGLVQHDDEASIVPVHQLLSKIAPSIEFTQDANGGHVVSLNESFVNIFGHTKESLTADIKWSNGGALLTWGGDLMARLLWSEADVLIFLQVLAVKFQELGPLEHKNNDSKRTFTRDTLSAFISEVRVAGDHPADELVIPCIIKSLHRETLKGRDITVTVALEFEILHPPKRGSIIPESSKEALERCKREKLSNSSEAVGEKQQNGGLLLGSNPGIPKPEEDMALLNAPWDWPTFEAVTTISDEEVMDASALVESIKSKDLDENAAAYQSDDQDDDEWDLPLEDVSDEAWLASLLDWTQ